MLSKIERQNNKIGPLKSGINYASGLINLHMYCSIIQSSTTERDCSNIQDIPAFLYCTYSEEQAYPVMKVGRWCHATRKMPGGTIIVTIVSIFKGGDNGLKENHCPVAVTTTYQVKFTYG